jgi:hypothetical protein
MFMNSNDSARLHDLLNRATAPVDDASNVFDAEAASLRRGWLALGRLIEGDQRAGGAAEGNDVEPIWQARQRSRIDSPAPAAVWFPWLIAAVAASVLIAASVTMIVRRFGGSADVQLNPQQIAHDDEPRNNASGSPLVTHVAPTRDNSSAQHRSVAGVPAQGDRWQWGDSVDDDITAVSRATLVAQQDWYAQSSRVGAVQSGLYELESEMDQGKP